MPMPSDEASDAAAAAVSTAHFDGANAASAATLSESALAELAQFGSERTVEAGEVLYRAGDVSYPFIVILDGEVAIIRADTEGEVVVTSHGAGRFLGELNMLTGQAPT